MQIKWIIISVFILFTTACTERSNKPINIGVLHSLSGNMALNERPLVDAVTLAVEEINQSGGILGRDVKIIVADGESNAKQFALEAEKLITEKKVSVIFGCWTSSCRKTVKTVVEKNNHLLFYPLQYEGLEQSKNIIYTGAAPNQQIIPSVHWAIENIGKRIYLVGSDYIFPRTANLIIKDVLNINGIKEKGEHYIPLNSIDVSLVMRDIKKIKPDLIFNTINGQANKSFFKALKSINSKAKVMSYSIAEPEVKQIGITYLEGHYASWNYFQSLNNVENKKFVNDFKQRFGQERVISDPMQSAYIAVYLWAQAVKSVGTADPVIVNQALKHQTFKAPEGIVSVDAETRHLWKAVRIARVEKDGQFKVVWGNNTPIRPSPFPSFRSNKYWLSRVKDFNL